jgi:hypothetical protein
MIALTTKKRRLRVYSVILVILIAATVAYKLAHVMTTDKGMEDPPLSGQHPNLQRSL